MGTNYIAPMWRMPRNANNTPVDKLSNYSIDFVSGNSARYIDCGTNLFTGSNITSISISCWVNTTASTSSMVIVSKDLANQGGTGLKNRNFLFQLVNDTVYWQTSSDGNNLSQTVVNSSGVTNGEWHHIVVTYEAGATSGTAEKKIYIDGQLRATDSAATIPNMYNNTTVPIEIGRRGDNARYYSGEISQVSIFDYALDLNQVDYLYDLNNPMVPGTANLTAPVAYYPLGDNSNPNAPGSFPNISVGADSVFDFDGSNYITAGDVNIIEQDDNGSLPYSISLWVNTPYSNSTQVLLSKQANSGSYNGFNIYRNNNFIYFILGSILSPQARISGYAGFAGYYDTWVNICLTYDGSRDISGFNLYFNKEPQTINSSANQPPQNVLNTADFEIGSRGGGVYKYTGEISNVQLWNTELSSSQVETLYNNGQPLMTGTQPQEANLKAWYKLNQSANYDQGIGPFKIEKVGSPDYSVSGNGCFTTGGVLRWQDTNNQVLSDGDYFTYYSPLIRCNSNDVDLVTTGGSYQTGISSGLEYSLEYSVDGGSWVVWKAQTVATNQSLQNWTVANVNNLNCNQSIQVRLRAVGGLFGTEQFNFNDVRINVSGVQTYFETFATAGLGWDSNSYTEPTDNYVDPFWQIPDNRSAYPQSFDFNGNSSYIDSSSYTLDGDFSISVWAKTSTFGPVYGMIFAVGNPSYLAFEKANRRFLWDDPTTGVYRSSNNVWEYDEWVHLILVKSGTTLQYYINGQPDTLTGTSTATTSGALTLGRWLGNSGNRLNGNLSNFQLWDTALNATQAETLYNNGVPLTTAIATDNLKGWWKLDNTELFDGTNWSVENQKYPASYESALKFPGPSNGTGISFSPLTINVTQANTYSAWIYPISHTSFWTIIAGAYSGTIPRIGPISLIAAGGSNWAIRSTQANMNTVSRTVTSDSISNNELSKWHHIMVIVNNLDVSFYLNGQPHGTATFNDAWTSSTIDLFSIGQFSNWVPNGYMSNIAIWDSDQSTNIANIYNNGTPQNSYTVEPIALWKLDNTTTGLNDIIGGKNGTLSGNIVKVNTFVSKEAGESSGMTEQNLVNNNVSVLNGESEGMNSTNLVTSNISRTQPYSNYSFNFDAATSDYISIPNPGSIFAYGESAFTFSGWVSIDAYSDQDGIFGRFDNANDRSTIKLGFTTPFNSLMFLTSENGNLAYLVWDGILPNPANSEWKHICLTYNAGTVKLYLNGADQGAGTPTGTIPTTMPNLGASTQLEIARDQQNFNARLLNGRTSNFCVFDRALTESEILKIYNNGVPQDLQVTSSFSNNILAWWPMDENSSYYDGTDWVVRDLEGSKDGNGINTGNVEDMVGNAPGSEANGTGKNLVIADLKGNMYNSDKNAYSINMADYADGVTNPANSGRSTDTP